MRILQSIKVLFYIVCALFFIGAVEADNSSSHSSEKNHSKADWHWLRKGNQKFVDNSRYAKQRKKLVAGQHPDCIILSCSDSRVPPEIVFQKTKLGEFFTVRVAGNVADDVVVDSIEYAVTHFYPSSIVVMGHSKCGAVIGALDHLRENHGKVDVQNGHLYAVLIPIEMAIVEAGIDIYAPNALELSIKANVKYVCNQLLQKSPAIAKAVSSGALEIIGAEYSLETGGVTKLFSIKS